MLRKFRGDLMRSVAHAPDRDDARPSNTARIDETKSSDRSAPIQRPAIFAAAHASTSFRRCSLSPASNGRRSTTVGLGSTTTQGCNLRARITGSNTVDTIVFDLHGYDTSNIEQSCLLEEIVEQAWQTGAKSLDLIHGHGRNRALRRPFANTNTGFLGLAVRVELRHSTNLRQWIKSSTLNCKDPGVTSVRLKPNPAPTRTGIDHSVLAPRPHASVTDGWAARYP
jgi:hypothetical protein